MGCQKLPHKTSHSWVAMAPICTICEHRQRNLWQLWSKLSWCLGRDVLTLVSSEASLNDEYFPETTPAIISWMKFSWLGSFECLWRCLVGGMLPNVMALMGFEATSLIAFSLLTNQTLMMARDGKRDHSTNFRFYNTAVLLLKKHLESVHTWY